MVSGDVFYRTRSPSLQVCYPARDSFVDVLVCCCHAAAITHGDAYNIRGWQYKLTAVAATIV